MAYFPVFIDLTGKRCVCIGGGPVAARKARILLDFGAQVAVLDPSPSDGMELLAKQEEITLHRKRYAGTDDLKGAALVVAATDDTQINQTVYADAKNLGIHINVVDVPELCTFFFPAIVRRGELVAGISTSGGYPALAARLRDLLEEDWPEDLGLQLKLLAETRKQIRSKVSDPEQRRTLIAGLMDAVLNKGGTGENQADG